GEYSSQVARVQRSFDARCRAPNQREPAFLERKARFALREAIVNHKLRLLQSRPVEVSLTPPAGGGTEVEPAGGAGTSLGIGNRRAVGLDAAATVAATTATTAPGQRIGGSTVGVAVTDTSLLPLEDMQRVVEAGGQARLAQRVQGDPELASQPPVTPASTPSPRPSCAGTTPAMEPRHWQQHQQGASAAAPSIGLYAQVPPFPCFHPQVRRGNLACDSPLGCNVRLRPSGWAQTSLITNVGRCCLLLRLGSESPNVLYAV
ncbi:hypothetical protein Vretifemale_17888, partial [Volvox reticuliferus]